MTDVVLNKPIQLLNGTVVDSVTVSEPTGAMIKEAQRIAGPYDSSVTSPDGTTTPVWSPAKETAHNHSLIAGSIGMKIADVEKMVQSDIVKIYKVLSNYFLSTEEELKKDL